MDHSHHDHMANGHDGMGEQMCNMNMLFTWSTDNLCIIFHSWRITGIISLLVSLAAVAALTAGYEYVRELSRRYEERISQQKSISVPTAENETESRPLLYPGRNEKQPGGEKVIKATFYAVQVFYSFFIMLLFMTYNGWVMLAVAGGAFVGYLIWGSGSASKSVACH